MIEGNQYSDEVLYSDLMEQIDAEEIERKKRAAKREIRRRKKRKKLLIRLYIRLGLFILIFVLIIIIAVFGVRKLISFITSSEDGASEAEFGIIERVLMDPGDINVEEVAEKAPVIYEAIETPETKSFGSDVTGQYAILVDVDNGTILAQRECNTMMSPASMTKVLTLLVACEHINDLDDKITMSIDMLNYAYSNGCSTAGFAENETVTVRDLLYGTILPSGGDAALGLAYYVSGSQEAFVDLMNQKLDEMGLSQTAHFTNCIGLYDQDHYCTAYDMAMIMDAAIHNDICKEVLNARKYTTSSTEQHRNGIELSNWFLRRIEDKECGVTFMGGKTGFVNESGNCAVSYAVTPDGGNYICVIANAQGSWRCIYDHVAVYKQFFDTSYVPLSETEIEDQIEQDESEEEAENQ
ncbi:MAG: serine hydrolase [Lachnospiraceae bacterium]|nr:serine hydrolase [Lachnospiraceae bacterium]